MRIGLDLGGTKIEGVALGDDGARARAPPGRRRRATTTTATLEAIAGLVARARARRPARRGSVGVGMPGALSPATGLVKNANSTWLIGQPLDRDLARALGRPVRFANDANCFALSEAVDGAAAGARVVFGVIVGHGHGRRRRRGPAGAHRARTRSPASGATTRCRGRATASGPGRACYCGKTGCVETFLSGPGPRPRLPRRRPARTSTRAGDRGPRRARRRGGRRRARALRGPDGPGARGRPQHPRPRRGRARRRHVAGRAALRERAAALAGVGVLRPRRHRCCGRPSTATRAASAARPGSGAPAGGR